MDGRENSIPLLKLCFARGINTKVCFSETVIAETNEPCHEKTNVLVSDLV